ncbi:hypothetical protein EJ08DRAFT_365903 [Tothia fuscella]|uniref:Uncharacterized protein n=1 Tax=Tothia fuscella TaxID=1048955 RepID=A0A9P4NM27_9PEZI|nr:hypothetical protein EJ08DRAFT_365903 [Tothia fuscella]
MIKSRYALLLARVSLYAMASPLGYKHITAVADSTPSGIQSTSSFDHPNDRLVDILPRGSPISSRGDEAGVVDLCYDYDYKSCYTQHIQKNGWCMNLPKDKALRSISFFPSFVSCTLYLDPECPRFEDRFVPVFVNEPNLTTVTHSRDKGQGYGMVVTRFGGVARSFACLTGK